MLSQWDENKKENKLSKDWSWLSKQWITDGHNTTTEGMLIFWQHAHSKLFTGLFLLQTASTHTYTYTCMYVCMYKHTHTHHTSKSLWTLQFSPIMLICRCLLTALVLPHQSTWCPSAGICSTWHRQMAGCATVRDFTSRSGESGRSADSFTHCGPCHADRKWHSNLLYHPDAQRGEN